MLNMLIHHTSKKSTNLIHYTWDWFHSQHIRLIWFPSHKIHQHNHKHKRKKDGDLLLINRLRNYFSVNRHSGASDRCRTDEIDPCITKVKQAWLWLSPGSLASFLYFSSSPFAFLYSLSRGDMWNPDRGIPCRRRPAGRSQRRAVRGGKGSIFWIRKFKSRIKKIGL